MNKKILALSLVLITLLSCSENDNETDIRRVQPREIIELSNSGENSAESNLLKEASEATSVNKGQKPKVVIFDKSQVEEDYAGVKLKVLDISERSYEGGNALSVTFSVPVDPSKKYDEYLVVSENKTGNVDGSWVISTNGKIAYFPQIEPKTEYKIQVYKGLKAGNGKKLTKNISETVNTRDVKASVSFDSLGHFLSLDMHTGLPVVSVNVNEIDVDFHKVKDDGIYATINQFSNNRTNISRYRANGLSEYTDLVYSARYQIKTVRNKRKKVNLPIQNIKALNEPGLYVAVLQAPGSYYGNVHLTYFSVTDIGVHIRSYGRQMDVHVASLETGLPIKNVEIELLNNNGEREASSTTTPEGYASISNSSNSGRHIIARRDGSLTVVPINQPSIDMSDFDIGSRPYKAHELFIYSPRNLYRPGETVQFSALLRNQDGAKSKTTPPLPTKIINSRGQTKKEFKLQSNREGYYEYALNLPADAKTGLWEMRVRNLDGSYETYKFKVEEFLPERLKLTFNPGVVKKPVFNSKEDIKVKVLGEYLYGAPAAKNRFDARINVVAERSPFETLKGFEFGDINGDNLKHSFSIDSIELDDYGQGFVNLDSRWESAKSPLAVNIIGSLYETGGRPITRKHTVVVWPAKTHIGIRPLFKENESSANSKIGFELVSANANGQKLAASNLEVALIREDRRWFWTYNINQGWHSEYSEREYPEYTSSISIKSGGIAKLEIPVEWGKYRLEVIDKQEGTKSSFRFRAGRSWYHSWNNNKNANAAARPDKVSLALDKESYSAGDIASLSIVTPNKGEALVIVEADKPLLTRRISIPKGGTVVSIPVDKSWNRHDIYISVIHIEAANEAQSITPKRSIGLLHLPLERESRKLNIEIEAEEKIVPEQNYDVKIKISKNNKAVKKAYVTLAAVDVGVLSLTDFKTPDPHTYFFEQRRYQIDSRDMYNKLIELNKNDLAKQKFGGDAALSRGGKNAQAEVQIVSLFSGLVNVNSDGTANVTLKIPDFNGRLRLMAIAFTEDSFGSAEQEMTVAAPLVTQLAMPRFLAMGDKSNIALDIHNLSGEEQQLKIIFTGSEPLVEFNDEKTETIKNGEKITLIYPVDVSYKLGKATLSVKITGMKTYQVNKSWRLAVRAAYPGISRNKQAWLEKNDSIKLTRKELKNYVENSVEAVVSINNQVDMKVSEQMQHLLKYPYGCLEQSTSSTYPWVYATEETLNKLGIKNKTKKGRLESLKFGLDRIQAKQLANGAYGLWSNKDNEEHWLTAYVGDFLSDAKDQGVKVDEKQYTKTMNRLADYISRKNGNYGHRWSDSDEHYQIAYRAYAAYVLSRHNRANLSHLRQLAQHHLGDAESFLPAVHLGLALINQGDSDKGKELLDNAFDKKRGNRYYGDYGSEIRDSSLAIHLLIRHKQQLDRVKQLALSLAELLEHRNYLSTQERNALFLAGIALDASYSKEWEVNEEVLGAVTSIKKKGGLAKKYQSKELVDGIKFTNQNKTAVIVNLDYVGYENTAPEPESTSGLNIIRDYFDTKGKRLDARSMKVGDLVLVRLRVSAQHRHPDMLVVDLLPAGLELENQNLNHSIKLDTVEFDGKNLSAWTEQSNIVFQEYRDDRYVAAIDAHNNYSSYLFYLARAVTPGVYNVPAPLVEDMYRPEERAIGAAIKSMKISNP